MRPAKPAKANRSRGSEGRPDWWWEVEALRLSVWVKRSQVFGSLPDLRNFLLNLLRVLREIVPENDGLTRGVVHQSGQHGVTE